MKKQNNIAKNVVQDGQYQPDYLPSDWPNAIASAVEVHGKTWRAIGRGVRFAVYANYDIVLKIPLSAAQLLHQAKSIGGDNYSISDAEAWFDHNQEQIRQTQNRLANSMLPRQLFSDLQIDELGRIFQKRLRPLSNVFQVSTVSECRTLVDSAIDRIAECLGWGVFSPFFALPMDFACNDSTDVVMMGLGQLIFNRDTALKILVDKPWRTSITGMQSYPELSSYFVEQLETRFTDIFVRRNWAISAKRIARYQV